MQQRRHNEKRHQRRAETPESNESSGMRLMHIEVPETAPKCVFRSTVTLGYLVIHCLQTMLFAGQQLGQAEPNGILENFALSGRRTGRSAKAEGVRNTCVQRSNCFTKFCSPFRVSRGVGALRLRRGDLAVTALLSPTPVVLLPGMESPSRHAETSCKANDRKQKANRNGMFSTRKRLTHVDTSDRTHRLRFIAERASSWTTPVTSVDSMAEARQS